MDRTAISDCINGLREIAKSTYRKDFRDSAMEAINVIKSLSDPEIAARKRLLDREAASGIMTRVCSVCEKQRGISVFRIKKQRLKSGNICFYRDAHCDSCRWKSDKRRIANRDDRAPQIEKRKEHDARSENAAFVGWRGPVSGQIIGARL